MTKKRKIANDNKEDGVVVVDVDDDGARAEDGRISKRGRPRHDVEEAPPAIRDREEHISEFLEFRNPPPSLSWGVFIHFCISHTARDIDMDPLSPVLRLPSRFGGARVLFMPPPPSARPPP
jgi:hypothetical protein